MPPSVSLLFGSWQVDAGAPATSWGVSWGFAGDVDTYSASSSDPAILTVSMEGAQLTMEGVAAGSATVTVIASNSAGSASQEFVVTVSTAVAPSVATPLEARTLTVGATEHVNLRPAFGGRVESYKAASSDPEIASTRVESHYVTLTAVAAGTATVTVTANNNAGSASQSFTVTVNDLALSVSAPSHCLGSEGRAEGRTRVGVGTMAVSYTVTGGTAPYVVSSPEAAADSDTATGILRVSCARSGVDLNDVAADADVVVAGPKTVQVTAGDASGATVTQSVTVNVAEDAYTSDYSGGTLLPGRTYVVGDTDDWALITLPEGLELNLDGVTESNGEFLDARFTDTATGSLIVLDWTTGTELHREVIQPIASEDSTTPPRDVNKLFDMLSESATTPEGLTRTSTSGEEANTWRPYEGLPSDTRVMLEDAMLEGYTLTVCNLAELTDFPKTRQAEYYAEYNSAFSSAIAIWNSKIMTTSPSTGTRHKIFEHLTSCEPEEQTNTYPGDILIDKVERYAGQCSAYPIGNPAGTKMEMEEWKNWNKCAEPFKVADHIKFCSYPGGCAFRIAYGAQPPKIGRESLRLIGITQSHVSEPSTGTIGTHAPATMREFYTRHILHELGHFLGFGDYKYNCPTKDRMTRSLFAYPPGEESDLDECVSEPPNLVTARDMEDLHQIYHPDALKDLTVSGMVISGTLPSDVGRPDPNNPSKTLKDYEYSAFGYVVGSRGAGSSAPYNMLGGMPTSKVADASGAVTIRLADLDLPEGFSPAGKEFVVAGVTRGDWKRGLGSPGPWEDHSEVSLTLGGVVGPWTLGTPEVVYGPPATPVILSVHGGDGKAQVFWHPVPGATRYVLSWGTGKNALTNRELIDTATTAYTITGLNNGTTYFFAVRAYNKSNSGGERSKTRSAIPALLVAPTGLTAGTPTQSEVSLSWDSVVSATAYDVRIQVEGAKAAAQSGSQNDQTFTSPEERERTLKVSSASATVDDLRAGTTYRIDVRALMEITVPLVGAQITVSNWSSSVTITTDNAVTLAAPAGLRADVGNNRIRWSWNAVANATGYEVAWTGGGSRYDGSLDNQIHLELNGVSLSATYVFRVRGRNDTGVSPWSTVTITTPPRWTTPPPPPPTTTTTRPSPPTTTATTATTTTQPVGKRPPAPSGVTAVATLDSITVAWNASAGATSYEVRSGNATPVRVTGTSLRFAAGRQWTLYRFSVRARNAAGTSNWATTSVRTPARVSGQVAVLRMPPTPTGYTLSFAFRPTDESLIKPALRFLRYSELSPNWWIKTSEVIRTTTNPDQTLGKVTMGQTSEGKIRVCFISAGAINRFCPRTHTISYDAMTLNRWYYSSTFSFTVTPSTGQRAESLNANERLAHALPAGETVCGHC